MNILTREQLEEIEMQVMSVGCTDQNARRLLDHGKETLRVYKHLQRHFVPLVAALAVYGEGVNLRALVEKARRLNEAIPVNRSGDAEKHPISEGRDDRDRLCWREHAPGLVCVLPEGHADV